MMGKGLALGFALLLAGLGALHAQSVLGFPPGAFRSRGALDPIPIISASAWGDKGTWIDLSTTAIANDTATSNSTMGFASVRGTQGYDVGSGGKHYYEVKLLTAPAADAMHIGLLDATTATGVAMNTETLINGAGTYCNNGNSIVGQTGGDPTGVNLGAGCGLSTNDVLGVAFDATNGFHYLAKNNVWYISGDPTSGATGTGHIGAYVTVRTYYPWITIWGLVNAVAQIVTTTGSLTYTPPTGYSAWN